MKVNLVLGFVGLLLVSQAGSGPSTLKSATYRFDDLVAQKEANATFRPILDGLTHSGYRIDVHEVFLLPGSSPHHGHRHQQEVLFLVSEGELQVSIAGKTANTRPRVGCLRRFRRRARHSKRKQQARAIFRSDSRRERKIAALTQPRSVRQRIGRGTACRARLRAAISNRAVALTRV